MIEGKKLLPIGMSDFKSLIEADKYYVDKSMLIKEVFYGSQVLLLPRPRRFGKTLNLSMLQYFFNLKEDNSHLFKGLKISEEKELMEKHCGKYPVIYLTFKDVKYSNWHDCYRKLMIEIEEEYGTKRYLLNGDILAENEKIIFNNILFRRAEQADYEGSLAKLSEYLYRFHGQKPVILIDEYDVPIQQGYLYNEEGYYEKVVSFFRNFFGAGIKDNIYFEKTVMTGILRVAKESIFSGMNNLDVYSLIATGCSDKFGFTEEETKKIIVYYNLEYEIEEVKKWYNGYSFGGITIYNPWSILNFVNKKGEISPYWVNTSSNDLIKELLSKADDKVKNDLNTLINGGTIEKEIDENIVFSEIDKSDTALWNFLLFSGYLKYTDKRVEQRKIIAGLKIPNEEVAYVYENIFENWFGRVRYPLDRMLKDLTQGSIKDFVKMFREFCSSSFSYFDVSGREPEKFYHAFVLGMVVSLRQTHIIKSNRESGLGRYDVSIIPIDKAKRGIIFEFKSIDDEDEKDLAETAENAMRQIEEKRYEDEMRNEGVAEIVKIAIAFKGKEIKAIYN